MERLTLRDDDGRALLTPYGLRIYCSTQATADCICKLEEALKAQEPRVLTAEEMEQAGKNGDAVYVETPDDGCFWALAYPGEEPPKDKPFNYPGGVRFNAMEVNGDVYDGDFYSMTLPDGRVHHLAWRCWTAPPTDAQREATPWG